MTKPKTTRETTERDLARFHLCMSHLQEDWEGQQRHQTPKYVFDSNTLIFAMWRKLRRSQSALFQTDTRESLELRSNLISHLVSGGALETSDANSLVFDAHIRELHYQLDHLFKLGRADIDIAGFKKTKQQLLNETTGVDLNEVETKLIERFKFASYYLRNDGAVAVWVYACIRANSRTLSSKVPFTSGEQDLISLFSLALQRLAKRSPSVAMSDARAIVELGRLNMGEGSRSNHATSRNINTKFVFYTVDKGLIWLCSLLKAFSQERVFKYIEVRDACLLPLAPGSVPKALNRRAYEIAFSASHDLKIAFDRFKIDQVYLTDFAYGANVDLNAYSSESNRQLFQALGMEKHKVWDRLEELRQQPYRPQLSRSDGASETVEKFVSSSEDLMSEMTKLLPEPKEKYLDDAELLKRVREIDESADFTKKLDQAFAKVASVAANIRFEHEELSEKQVRRVLTEIADDIRDEEGLRDKLSSPIAGESQAGRSYFETLNKLDRGVNSHRAIAQLFERFGLTASERYLSTAFILARDGQRSLALKFCQDAINLSKNLGSDFAHETRLFEASLLRRTAQRFADLKNALDRISDIRRHYWMKPFQTLRIDAERFATHLSVLLMSDYQIIPRDTRYHTVMQSIGGLEGLEEHARRLLKDPEYLSHPTGRIPYWYGRMCNQIRLRIISLFLFKFVERGEEMSKADRKLFESTLQQCAEFYGPPSNGLRSKYSEILTNAAGAFLFSGPARRESFDRMSQHMKTYGNGKQKVSQYELERHIYLREKLSIDD